LSREIFGNIAGLKPSIIRSLEKLYRRKVPPQSIITSELAQELAYLSYQINRQIGVLINRKGDIDFVVVGSYNRIEIPELHGYRDHQARLKGLRFIHTHLVKKNQSSGLDQDDLIDLAFLRLDLIGAQEVYEDGRVGRIHIAHILPSPEFYSTSLDDEVKRLFYFFKPVYPWDLRENFQDLIINLEEEFERVSGAQALHEKEDRAILIFVRKPGDLDWENKLAELKELARTAGVKVVGEVVQRRAQIDPRYVIGKGKLLEVLIEC
jgi:GTPases